MNQIHRKKRALVICPGRGTYNKEELGYLERFHRDKTQMIATIDEERRSHKQIPIQALDSADKYSMRQHTTGENASSLIYACAKADFMDINQDKFEITAITGNSMGWYIACALSGALTHPNAARLINTMGSMMSNGIIGGQAIYPVVDDRWQSDVNRQQEVHSALEKINQSPDCQLFESIRLGGYAVLGGNEAALNQLTEQLPELDNRYPMRLFNHAAFHTPLLNEIVTKAQQQLPPSLFSTPVIPMVDGEGHTWQPYATSLTALYRYTLGTQVNSLYDFSKAIEVSIKEFAPDVLIIPGPGATLGGAVAQILIQHAWFGLTCKADFIARQKEDPVIISMGMENQRELVN